MIFLRNYFIATTEKVDVVSVIHEVNRALREANIPDGLVTVVVPGPGAGVTIVELLPEIVAQLKEAARVFPGEGIETLSRRKEEIAVGPRVAAAMLGRSVAVPVAGGKLILAPREEIVLVDFESSARRREFAVQVMGEQPAAAKGPAPRRR